MSPSTIQDLDLDGLESLLDADLTIVPSPSTSGGRTGAPVPRPGSARGGESIPASVSRPTPRSSGGFLSGIGGGGTVPWTSPAGDAPLPVVFIPAHATASTCRGLYVDTSRFCIKPILPGGEHHCGTKNHARKKQPVEPDTYWVPGGMVKGELVARCDPFVKRADIPTEMLPLFAPTELRTSSEWCHLIIDVVHRVPSISAVNSEGSDAGDEAKEEDSVVSMLGFSGLEVVPPAPPALSEVGTAEGWGAILREHRISLDWLSLCTVALNAKLPLISAKIDDDVAPSLNKAAYDIGMLRTAAQEGESNTHGLMGSYAAMEDLVEQLDKDLKLLANQVHDMQSEMVGVSGALTAQVLAWKTSETKIVNLMHKSILRADGAAKKLAEQLEELRRGTATNRADDDSIDRIAAMLEASGPRARAIPPTTTTSSFVNIGGSEVPLTLEALYHMQCDINAKVELQVERSKTQGVAFHKVAFGSQTEFTRWYCQGNETGKALSAFVDLISIWAFAANSSDSPMEFLQRAAKSKTVDLMSGVDVDYAHSMTIRYPLAFEAPKSESMTSYHRFGIFDSLEKWKGTGAGDGKKERLLEQLRLAVERHRNYCDETMAPGAVKDHAIQSATFTQSFFEALMVHLDNEIAMFVALKLPEKKIFTLLSNELMQVCDDLFECRQLGINVDYANKQEVGMKFAWVTFNALGKMAEYFKVKFKNHPTISSIFIRFLTQQTGNSSAAGLKSQVDELDATLRKLKEGSATKEALTALHNKVELIVSRNNLKKT